MCKNEREYCECSQKWSFFQTCFVKNRLHFLCDISEVIKYAVLLSSPQHINCRRCFVVPHTYTQTHTHTNTYTSCDVSLSSHIHKHTVCNVSMSSYTHPHPHPHLQPPPLPHTSIHLCYFIVLTQPPPPPPRT
jgi:hypothetical protein